MGNDNSQQQKSNPIQDKMQLEIACAKVKAYIELNRDRKLNSVLNQEKLLLNMIQAQPQQRNKMDEIHKAQNIIIEKKYVQACQIVIRYCDLVKDRSNVIIQAKGHPEQINDLMPYIESIIWSSKHLNLKALGEFSSIIGKFFGNQIFDSVEKSLSVDPELKECFKDLIATPTDIYNYFTEFINKHQLDLNQVNSIGHEFSNQVQKGGNNNGFPGGNNGFTGGNGGFGGNGGQQQFNQQQQFQPQQQFIQQQQQFIPQQQFVPQFQPQQQPFIPQQQQFIPQQQPFIPQQQPFIPQQQQQQFNPQYQSPSFINQQQPFNQQFQGGFNQNIQPNIQFQQQPNNFQVPSQSTFNQQTFNVQQQQQQQQQQNQTNHQQNNTNNGLQQQNTNLPSLDDFEERMRKLRGGI